VGVRQILETYLHSVLKNTSKIDIFPHRTKSVLTSVIGACCELNCFEHCIQLHDQMSSSRAHWGLVVPASTHPSGRLVQENVPEAVFLGIGAYLVFGM
jgi:pentatricopeptide repeat protein